MTQAIVNPTLADAEMDDALSAKEKLTVSVVSGAKEIPLLKVIKRVLSDERTTSINPSPFISVIMYSDPDVLLLRETPASTLPEA